MAVRVLRPGFVHIFPDVLGWKDVVRRAHELIEKHGWIKGESGAADRGYSVHGALGEAASQLSGEEGGKSAPVARGLREDSVRVLSTVMPSDYADNPQADILWNDKQRSKSSVLKMLQKALTQAA